MAPEMKKRRLDPSLQLLTVRGEKFLRMFDDAAGTKSDTKKAKNEAAQDEDAYKVSDADEQATGAPSIDSRAHNETLIGKAAEQQDGRRIKLPDTVDMSGLKARKREPRAGLSTAKQKRLFLSGQDSSMQSKPTAPAKKEGTTPVANFSDMLRDVHAFGSSGLDKKQQASAEAARLAKLHAKPEKSARMPASVARPKMKRLAEKEKEDLEAAIASGMVQQKGLSKKKRRQKEQERRSDLGLYEDGGAFRNGVLDVRRLPGESKKKRWKAKKKA